MSEIITSRRSFLFGLGALIAAPAIVRASVIMPVKPVLIVPEPKIITDLTFPIEGYAAIVERQNSAFVSGHIDDLFKDVPSRRQWFERVQMKIADFRGEWKFKDHPHNNPAMVTLRNGETWQRRGRHG